MKEQRRFNAKGSLFLVGGSLLLLGWWAVRPFVVSDAGISQLKYLDAAELAEATRDSSPCVLVWLKEHHEARTKRAMETRPYSVKINRKMIHEAAQQCALKNVLDQGRDS